YLICDAYADNCDQHSFPTRRSSDLEAGERNIVRPYAKVEVTGDEIVDDEDTVAPELAIDGLTDGEVVTESEITFTVKAEDDVDEDRKSTRLNSSHVSISYAVFCLKK